MNQPTTKGFDDRVHRHRAVPAGARDLDDDPASMVQEQIARIKHLFSGIDGRGKSVLDFGCGTGFNCRYVREKQGVARAAGVDISPSTIEFARKLYPEERFEVGDVCDPNLSIEPGTWDIVLSCEVFEHVPDVDAMLAGIRRHLAPEGAAYITTPNKLVFSLGHEPSPVNETHLKEFVLDEFKAVLRRHFSSIEVSGQRLTSPTLSRRREALLRRNIRDFKLLGRHYWNAPLRQAWKTLRGEPILRWIEGPVRFHHRDFEFTDPPTDDAIWFCAIVRP